MHFFYIDEAGCNLRDLDNPESPIFTLGGIVVKDKGWNTTHTEFERIIAHYFNNQVPDGFELHSHQLLSPHGSGPFKEHDRERRSQLAIDLLELLEARGHQVLLLAIDKSKMKAADTTGIKGKDHVELTTPYLLCYDNAITLIEWYTKEKLGSSARAMVIIDQKDDLRREIEDHTKLRRFHPVAARRIKWIAEFSYPVDSKKNPMVQLSDLVCFVAKKYLGIENGYHDSYSADAKNFYRQLYTLIDDRKVRQGIVPEEGRYADAFNDFMSTVTAKPKNGWKNRIY